MSLSPRPSKIVCIGRNYAAHAAEHGAEVPSEPIVFLKPSSSLLGDGEPIILPPQSSQVEFEGEIGVIIGRRARMVDEVDAWSHVGAIVPLNDVTARDLQSLDSQWTRAKGFDTFCPVGRPVSVGEVRPDELGVVTRVNGEVRQRGTVGDMVFQIPFLIAYISRIMTLEPGDILATGTPEGVGPLSDGDEVEVEIPGVGSVKNPVRSLRE
jgi:2-keto-4-pentenoate hydratase/2-oxohepta-3-ene-1,7-dioic acid hydratase in catechol pathway